MIVGGCRQGLVQDMGSLPNLIYFIGTLEHALLADEG